MNIDLTQIAVALIALLTAIVTGFLIPLIKSKLGLDKEKLTENQQMLLKLAVTTAVKAAEQIYTSEEGQKKKSYVLNILAQQGYKIDSASLDAAIEAAVLELHRALPIEFNA